MTNELDRASRIAGRKLTNQEERDLVMRKVAEPDRPLWARVRDTLWGVPVFRISK
jgi:hypothetical protein